MARFWFCIKQTKFHIFKYISPEPIGSSIINTKKE